MKTATNSTSFRETLDRNYAGATFTFRVSSWSAADPTKGNVWTEVEDTDWATVAQSFATFRREYLDDGYVVDEWSSSEPFDIVLVGLGNVNPYGCEMPCCAIPNEYIRLYVRNAPSRWSGAWL